MTELRELAGTLAAATLAACGPSPFARRAPPATPPSRPPPAPPQTPGDPLSSPPFSFSPEVNVSNSPGDSVFPTIAIDDQGTIHAVWAEQWQIVYSRSVDGGQTFTPFVQLSTGTGGCVWPTLAVSGPFVFVGWSQDPDNATSDQTKQIMFTRSTNGGGSFSPQVNLSISAGQSQYVSIGVGTNGEVFVVWDDASPTRALAMRRSTDCGSTFDPMRQIFPVTAPACIPPAPTSVCTPYPSVLPASTPGMVFLVWHDLWNGALQVEFSRSLDSGDTFSAPANISQAPVDAHCAAITQGPDGRILVAYEQGRVACQYGDDAAMVQSLDDGMSFSPTVMIHTATTGTSDYPTPTVAQDGTIAVGWEDDTGGGNLAALLATSSDNGATFSDPYDLSANDPNGTSVGVIPAFAPAGNLYVVWEDHDDGGYSVPADVMLRVGTPTSTNP
jgi:hypothetical protein